jgi:hypothetical protein
MSACQADKTTGQGPGNMQCLNLRTTHVAKHHFAWNPLLSPQLPSCVALLTVCCTPAALDSPCITNTAAVTAAVTAAAESPWRTIVSPSPCPCYVTMTPQAKAIQRLELHELGNYDQVTNPSAAAIAAAAVTTAVTAVAAAAAAVSRCRINVPPPPCIGSHRPRPSSG